VETQSRRNDESECNEQFREFITLLSTIQNHSKLFPKQCRTCNSSFNSLSDYICGTKPKGHSLEDCSEVMKKPYTMIYRHCRCGNTLVLTITDAIFPRLQDFWTMIQHEAEVSGREMKEIIAEFAEEWEMSLLEAHPCK
jgi:hypothetical protein